MIRAVAFSLFVTLGLVACSEKVEVEIAEQETEVPTSILSAEEARAKVQAALNAQAVLEPLEESEMDGFYYGKVTNGPGLFISKDGEFVLAGEVYQVQGDTLVDLSEKRAAVARQSVVKNLDRDSEIVFSPQGEKKAVIHVFTDVDCGYCRKLHQEMEAYNAEGIEVRYMAYPRAGIGSPSYNKIASAWCANDKQRALTDLKQRKPIPENVCDGNPVPDHYALGRQIGVSGTPAILLEDGRLLPGYRPAAALAAELGI